MRLLLFYHGTTFVSWDAALCALVIGVLIGVWIMSMLVGHEDKVARQQRDTDALLRELWGETVTREQARVAAIRKASRDETREAKL